MKSFEELALLSLDTCNGKVLIVCYSTTHSTTHAICWDIGRKRILDSEYRNANIFSYNVFNTHELVVQSIVEALSTTVNIPCIFSIAYWIDKSIAKNKALNEFIVFITSIYHFLNKLSSGMKL